MNKSNLTGLVLIGLIMFGFTFYQSKQYEKQMVEQARLDSIARVEQMVEMAVDSARMAKEAGQTNVKVSTIPAYKDTLLTAARLADASVYKLSNDKIDRVHNKRCAAVFCNDKGLQDIRQY